MSRIVLGFWDGIRRHIARNNTPFRSRYRGPPYVSIVDSARVICTGTFVFSLPSTPMNLTAVPSCSGNVSQLFADRYIVGLLTVPNERKIDTPVGKYSMPLES